jgi:phosphate transport system protein
MSLVFANEVEKLKRRILAMSAQVEESVILAVRALLTRDENLAEQVIRGDYDVDQVEVEVEEDALKLLALYQPVAMDLRFLTTVLKINNDLERIGDLATNIAKRAVKLCKDPAALVPEQMIESAGRARDMVRDSLNSFVRMDADVARSVCGADDRIDRLCSEVRKTLENEIAVHPEHLSSYLDMLLASRNIERIGDHATNIAEDVVYLVEGVIVRHRSAETKS